MQSRDARGLALVFLVLAVPGSSLGAARRPAALRPQTVLRVSSPIRGFAQDGSRIAWLTGTAGRRCTRTFHVRSLDTQRTQTAPQSGCSSNSKPVSRLALAGSAVAWDSFVDGNRDLFDAAIVTAGVPSRRPHRVASIRGRRGAASQSDPYPTVAGAGGLLAFATPDGVRRIVDGKSRRLSGFPDALGLAVGRGKVAAVGQEIRPGDGCGCVSSPDWRADGKIGFLSELALPPQGKKEITLIDPSGSGRTVITDDGQWRFDLDWSLDGTTLTYTYTGNGSTLAVAAADGSGAHDLGQGYEPALSPNGSTVAFSRYYGAFSLYVANTDGSDEHLVGLGGSPAWSPDGTRLAYTDADGWLRVVDADGSNAHQLGSLKGGGVDWSPDGTKLAYDDRGIWVADADGSNARQLTTYPQDFNPHWSPDGQSLVFESNRNDFDPKDHGGLFEGELFVVNADGTGLRPLTYSVPWSWSTVGEVRNATGHRVSSFEAAGASAGVALAGTKVAVGTQDSAGRGLLTLFASATGRRLARASLPGPAPLVVGANQRWVVFRTGARTINAFDLRTSKARMLAVARAAPIGLSVSGRRVAWAENLRGQAQVRAFLLPR